MQPFSFNQTPFIDRRPDYIEVLLWLESVVSGLLPIGSGM